MFFLTKAMLQLLLCTSKQIATLFTLNSLINEHAHLTFLKKIALFHVINEKFLPARLLWPTCLLGSLK